MADLPWPDLGVAPHMPEDPMADVPRSYTPLCAQCGKWFLLAQRMERERDEAREALASYRADHQCCVETVTRERDEARAQVAALERCRAYDADGAIRRENALGADLDRLRALLREVEWEGGYDGWPCCPVCGAALKEGKGHDADCRLTAALGTR